MEAFGYRRLDVYALGKEFVKCIYEIVRKFPKEEQYALCDQLRRTAVSVTSNIAEGSSRSSHKEFAHYIEISFGSLMEVMSQLELAVMFGYITHEELATMDQLAGRLNKMLSALRRSLLQYDIK